MHLVVAFLRNSKSNFLTVCHNKYYSTSKIDNPILLHILAKPNSKQNKIVEINE